MTQKTQTLTPDKLEALRNFMQAALPPYLGGPELPEDLYTNQSLVSALLGYIPARARDRVKHAIRLITIYQRVKRETPDSYDAGARIVAGLLAGIQSRKIPRADHSLWTLQLQRGLARIALELTDYATSRNKGLWITAHGIEAVALICLYPCYCKYPDHRDRGTQQAIIQGLRDNYTKGKDNALPSPMVLALLATAHTTTPQAIQKRLSHKK